METVDKARLGARKILDHRVHDRTVLILGSNAFVDMEDVPLHKKTDGESLAHCVQQIQQKRSSPQFILLLMVCSVSYYCLSFLF